LRGRYEYNEGKIRLYIDGDENTALIDGDMMLINTGYPYVDFHDDSIDDYIMAFVRVKQK
jgi:hypothetical protein